MDWTIETRASAGPVTITLASHAPVPAIRRIHSNRQAFVGLFTSVPPRASIGAFPGTAGKRFRPIGRLMVIPPETELEVFTPGEPYRQMIWCHLDSAKAAVDGLSWSGEPRLMQSMLDLQSLPLARLVRALAREAAAPRIASATRIEGLSLLLMAELAGHLERERRLSKGGLARWQLERVKRLILHSAVPPSLAILAAACGISERQLTRAFRQSTGSSIGNYAQSVRVEAATRLLGESPLPLKQIAAQLGFATSASFSRFMRRNVGETASDYRREQTRTGEQSVDAGEGSG